MLENRTIETKKSKQVEQLQSRTTSGKKTQNRVEKRVEITEIPDDVEISYEDEYEIQKQHGQQGQHRQHGQYGPFSSNLSLPTSYARNMDLLSSVEEFIDEHDFFEFDKYKNEKQLWEDKGEFLSHFDFLNIKKMVKIFNDINYDINDIDDGIIDKHDVENPAQKISQLKKVSSKYI